MDFLPLKPYVSKGRSDLGQSSSSLSSPSPADRRHHPGSNTHAARQHGSQSETRGYTTGAEKKGFKWKKINNYVKKLLIKSIKKTGDSVWDAKDNL